MSSSASSAAAAAAGRQPQQQQQQPQQLSAGAGTAVAGEASGASKYELTDQIVLDYLKKKGLGNAALELQSLLETSGKKEGEEQAGAVASAVAAGGVGSDANKAMRERLEEEEALNRNQRSLLSKSTGGGYGYDRDAAWPIAAWGVPDTGRTSAAGSSGDGAAASSNKVRTLGVDEARAYLDAFTSLQLWVLSLPDGDGCQSIDNPIRRAQQLLKEKGHDKASLSEVIEQLTQSNRDPTRRDTQFHLPPSAKPELLAVTFALLVHTYCELLEVGMETTAHMLRDAFRPVYDAIYRAEYRDLYQCTTVEDIVRLNSHNSQHMEALSNLKTILVQIASFQLRREELNAQAALIGEGQQKQAPNQKVAEYDRNISVLKQRYSELTQRATLAFDKMHDLPFLRRARAVRWQITLSSQSYGLLAGFFNSEDESLLAMSTLLQTKCELHIERRNPLPFTPCVVLEEDKVDKTEKSALDLNKMDINWAAPSIESALRSGASQKALPFPKYHLDDEYNTREDAERDKASVSFNRAVVVNGFRRLEALERKRDYESMSSRAKQKLEQHAPASKHFPIELANPLEPTILLTTLCASTSGPVLRPTSATASGSTSGRQSSTDISSIWEEPGLGLTCARICPPDGRRVAVGCDDAAIRIYDMHNHQQSPRIKGQEPATVLLGHKNGFPVFDVDWNRDGRSLLSAGGDGSVRLWDTLAVGPFGEVVPLSSQQTSKPQSTTVTASKATAREGSKSSSDPSTTSVIPSSRESSKKEPDMNVPGWKPDDVSYSSGAALAVYRGHTPSSPVWSVSFAPCGYYFCSTGGDATARLWTTDRPVPVRLLCGHTSTNVNCCNWHPNCNYVATGSDDKTARLWDIQTGRTVRLLDGCSAGINVVEISPGGRYLAGADVSGVVHLWDLGMGKKITEFHFPHIPPPQPLTTRLVSGALPPASTAMIHRLAFSACGSALAAGGDDCCVSIWDVRSSTLNEASLLTDTPVKTFPTRQTLIMDLAFTRRNLLLSVGKVVTPIPLATGAEQ